MRSVYAGGANVGMLSFRAGDEPSLRFELLNEWGLAPWPPLELTPADLRNGVASWRRRIDPKLLNSPAAPA
jgi:alkaline phosphatase D